MSTLIDKSDGHILIPVKWALKSCNKATEVRHFAVVTEKLCNCIPIPVCKDSRKF